MDLQGLVRNTILLQVLKSDLDRLRQGINPTKVPPVEHAGYFLVIWAAVILFLFAILDDFTSVLW